MKKFKYYYTHKEANFGKPLKTEVPGGTHIVFEVVLWSGDSKLLALRRPEGLHGAQKNGLYFVHGLIRFGESIEKCVSRLVAEQARMSVESIFYYSIDSWVDEKRHWHLAVNVIAKVKSQKRPPKDVSEIVEFSCEMLPKDMTWWTKKDLIDLFNYIKQQI
jgi:ADP-ribose pyrophosphatase YjhB (NUDIX family)